MDVSATSTAVSDLNAIQQAAIFMHQGGFFAWVVFVIWCFAIAVTIERFRALRLYDIDAEALMATIKKHVLLNEVQQAIQICSNTQAVLAQVLRSGLKRANQSKDQIQDAVECMILEVGPRVEKRLNYLALIANISTLCGLLGTIEGLITCFNAIANVDAVTKTRLLAEGISMAMHAT
ncbi:MAG: MotA/TolQ/ExbB proton channel family protein, partial [Pseudomonadota bacterium]